MLSNQQNNLIKDLPGKGRHESTIGKYENLFTEFEDVKFKIKNLSINKYVAYKKMEAKKKELI